LTRSNDVNETAEAHASAVSLERNPPVYSVTLWPHRSMSGKGFRALMLLTAVGFAFPMLAIGGGALAIGLLPFALATMGALWLMIRLNYRQARLSEHLEIWPDRMTVERREPSGRLLSWSANPHWVRIDLHRTRTIEHYLTLSSSERTIELGAFLTAPERLALAEELQAVLRDIAAGRRPSTVGRDTAASPIA
jgi:uncharacterized membrane protein